MTITLIQIGKTTERFVAEGSALYEGRLSRYCRFETVTIKPSTLRDPAAAAQDEFERLQPRLATASYLILLDETGRQLTSPQFARHLQDRMTAGSSDFSFLIGGAWGHAPELHARAGTKLALSAMTFPHQLVRVIFLEQLYRAMTILRGEPYHH